MALPSRGTRCDVRTQETGPYGDDAPAPATPMTRRFPGLAGSVVAIAILGLAIGAVTSLAAMLFVDVVALLNEQLFISPARRQGLESPVLLILVTILVPTIGGLVVGTLNQFIPEKRAHAPADIVRAVQGFEGHIPTRSGLLSTASSVISLGAGASTGQYGPLAHLGATLGSAIADIDERRRWMGNVGIGCGVASAIATAFNAPLAGIVFAHEVILRHYSLRAFAPITVAAAIGYVIVNAGFERPPLFEIEHLSAARPVEFAAFALIGVSGALVAAAYMRAMQLSTRLARATPIAPYVRPMVAGAALGVAAIWIPEILGMGGDTVRAVLAGDVVAGDRLLLLLVAKLLATALCIGFGFAGGVFGPGLLIGALFGAFAAGGAEWVLGELRAETVVYATCGMVAVISAVIGGPLTSILIVFELTRNYELATAAMVSVVFSNLVSYRIFGRSFFDVQLEDRGFDVSLGRDKVILGDRRVGKYLSRSYTVVAPRTPLAEVKRRLLADPGGEACMVDRRGRYAGAVTLSTLMAWETSAVRRGGSAADIADTGAPRLYAGTSLWEAMEGVADFTGNAVPVLVSEDDGRLLGVISLSALARAYADTLEEIRRDEHAAN